MANARMAEKLAGLTEALTTPRMHVWCGEVHVPGPCLDGVTRHTGTEWGVRNQAGSVLRCSDETAANEQLERYGPTVAQVVRREVTAWVPVTQSRTDRQPPDSSSETKGGQGADGRGARP